jgi:small subunit ribosomal protein S9
MTINGIEENSSVITKKNPQNADRIFQTIGKRKCAIATLSGYYGEGQIIVNGSPMDEYFQDNVTLLNKIMDPLKLLNVEVKYDIILRVTGGGLTGQAEAIQLAISKAFANISQENRSTLKKQGLLTRDARIKERKKYGLKKARKASQFSKR